ncbi:MAG: hypothetical protein K8U03_10990 [Planctomycetia bacterium]|nr:hypothetical protein [Planctomycetia bacterium]
MWKALPLVIGASVWASTVGAQQLPHQAELHPHAAGEVVGPPLMIAPHAATTVQLPTFNFFTISTTVLVPDSGTAFIGGVGGAGSGTRSNGLGSRAGASGVDAGGMSISVQVHDLRAMDRALLGDRKPPDAQAVAEQRWIARVERAKESTAGRPTMSVAEARRKAGLAR